MSGMRLTPKRKAIWSFLARDFAAYLVAYEPSLGRLLGDLPEVSDAKSWGVAVAAFQEARILPASSEPFDRVVWMNDVLEHVRDAFGQGNPSVGTCAALRRFANGPSVGWSYVGNSMEPLWKAAVRIGCTVEADQGEQRLLSPRLGRSGGRTVLGTFLVGTLKP